MKPFQQNQNLFYKKIHNCMPINGTGIKNCTFNGDIFVFNVLRVTIFAPSVKLIYEKK